ncbi:MAG TPA: pyridoxal phosphate-dependent aminotransferase [Polyangiaceae bacterium]|jgi:hypothetical protein
MFSRRTEHDSRSNSIASAVAERQARALPTLDLTVSNPTQTGLPYAEREILDALADACCLRYEPHAFGLPRARTAVAELLRADSFDVPIEHILLTASTSEAYSFLFKLLCDPGDEILLPAPSYPLFEHLSHFEGVRAVFYELAYDGAWHIDFDSLERARSARTRAIVVVNPNNPTGSFLKRRELARLVQFGLPIISDEVFASYALLNDRERVSSLLEHAGSLVFSLGGLSKLAGLPQLKLAWTAIQGPRVQVAEACRRLELVADTFLSPSAPVQHGLAKLLALRHELSAALRARIARNLSALCAALKGSAATLLHLEGGWYAVLRLPAFCDESAFVIQLLREDGVLVQPGFFYDFPNGQHVVLSTITPEADFREGVRRLAARVSAFG